MPHICVLLTLFIVSFHANAHRVLAYIELGELNTIQLNEHNLWSKTTQLDRPPSFKLLKQLYQNGQLVPSTLGKMGAYATKIKLANTKGENETWFVNLHINYLDVGTAYWESEQGDIIELASFGQTNSENPKLTHSQVFSLPLRDAESGTLWIYIQAKIFAIPADLKFESQTTFYRSQFLINSATSISFTVMMTLALIAFVIYIRTKYLVTLACTAYVGLHALGWFAASGSWGHLFSVSNFNPAYIGMLIFPFAIAAASQFTRLLFNCQEYHLKLAKIFNLLTISCLAFGILMPFIPFALSYLISHIIAIIWAPLCIGTGFYMLSKNDFRAKYYLAGNLLYGLTLVVYVISHTYKMVWNVSPELVVQLALTFDCICILLSLSEWLQIKQKEFQRSYITSRIDPLTQIGNRFAQNETLANLTGHYCLTFIDLDNFKQVNDQLGHEEGDQVLITTVDLIQKNLPGLGSLFRCGGDEFILVVSLNGSQNIETTIMQLSEALLKAELQLKKRGWVDTGLSFGTATSFETSNQSECLSLADQRMYKHKQEKKKTTAITA
ncbi:diguanylate cyclase [Psychromonas sp. psych-6C06]|uniref:sensor domain-containing diguanylate cyclase n=1 Tax=Psychromonas sp. psych-6C06 TaxID=2058089 RepID=UPI000C31EEB3|nr:diguanylate cyclase [Psychromonas sp. psych-6C06]PKF61137.1 diguanylate cyclase [Psychromonas sp. psych-6C06]